MLQCLSKVESGQSLSVDEPIQKEHADQEIEASDEVTEYLAPEDVYYDCFTQDKAEEETYGSIEYADLSVG
jgi:hypothetical protein